MSTLPRLVLSVAVIAGAIRLEPVLFPPGGVTGVAGGAVAAPMVASGPVRAAASRPTRPETAPAGRPGRVEVRRVDGPGDRVLDRLERDLRAKVDAWNAARGPAAFSEGSALRPSVFRLDREGWRILGVIGAPEALERPDFAVRADLATIAPTAAARVYLTHATGAGTDLLATWVDVNFARPGDPAIREPGLALLDGQIEQFSYTEPESGAVLAVRRSDLDPAAIVDRRLQALALAGRPANAAAHPDGTVAVSVETGDFDAWIEIVAAAGGAFEIVHLFPKLPTRGR
ncbi:hypothetical protein [Pinisolibacter aquiterrae]|uniref:hypothetical protein n=1 Tax=Pinisolibacter aquiterrae TaxID=2815579 RepID=UPI001C3CD762|nr:hypothetical protein [Pinisolibacter aquiterrae]MBV5266603.1 hypothetical protein [Pinisolibacter aquiterrae]MCC8234624.1 hypothetical protein [Pinisolibacter aquiterrae]